MKLKDKKLLSKSAVLEEMKRTKREVVLTMGAGDIDLLVEPLEAIFKK